MNNYSYLSEIISSLSQGGIIIIDTVLELIYFYIELPIQNFCWHFRRLNTFQSLTQTRLSMKISSNLTEILVQSYLISLIIYFLCLFIAQIYLYSLQRYYFLDPFLSNDRQCLNIKFIKNFDKYTSLEYLNENFLHENSIYTIQSYEQELFDTKQFEQLFHILNQYHFMICQRSLYLYARYSSYMNLLHSNYSIYRFDLPKYSRTFAFDQPPFLDLCVHTTNQIDLEQIRLELLKQATYAYPSLNLYFFNYYFTEITITLYQLNTQSTHLERVSIHTGWLYDIYSQFEFFKYHDQLSTILFDGYARGQQTMEFFNYKNLPVPADSLLGLNEMIQQKILVLPLCRTKK